jgi:hypothetical protein
MSTQVNDHSCISEDESHDSKERSTDQKQGKSLTMRIIINGFICFLLLFLLPGCAGIIFSNADHEPEKVADGVFRGPHPQESDLNELSRRGIKTVLSLENNPTVVAEEESVCHSLDLNFVNIPLSELAPPSPGDLNRAVRVIQQNRGHGVYIHCRRGIDRTGYVIASFRMLVEKYTFDAAYMECCDHGHSPLFYFLWKHALKEISREARNSMDRAIFLPHSSASAATFTLCHTNAG